MKNGRKIAVNVIVTLIGCGLFGVGFNMFLVPNGLNAGGMTGLSMIIGRIIGYEGYGIISALINIPLFALAGLRVGRKFFFGSLFGMAAMSGFIELLTFLPAPEIDPLIGALYGGVVCGVGLGAVFSIGFSTGGSDIIVRLLKLKWRNVPIGVLSILFDSVIAVLTGIVFDNFVLALYSGIAIFVTGRVVDMVVYHFDYSKVAIIITPKYEQVAHAINHDLECGVTLLHGEGSYYREQTKVILTAVKRQYLAELKECVVNIDPDAFIIVQEAHQVLGEGFARYSKDAL